MRRVGTQYVGWLVVAIAVLAGACTQAVPGVAAPAETPAVTPTDSPAETPTGTPPEAPALEASWTDAFELPLANGWTVRDCEGERTNICVYDGDRFVGDVEVLNGYPISAEQEGSEPAALLQAWAEDFLEHFRADRARGCGDFTFTADPVVEATVGGRHATRTGFTLTDRDGRIVERVVNHYTMQDGTVAIVNTDAYAQDGGCLGPSEYDPSFTPEDMAAFAPYLDELVAATPLPPVR